MSPRARLLACLLLFLAAAAVVTTYTLRRLDVPGRPALAQHGLQDFRDAIYFPSVALLDGHNPYDAADYVQRYPVGAFYPLYSPAALLLHLPFATLPYRTSQAVFVAINLALVPVLAWIALRAAGIGPVSPAAVLAVAALILISRPGQWNAFTGQCTLYVVIAAYAALLLARTRPTLAGLGLAVASLKPTYGAPLALLMLCRGDRRAVAIGLGLAALLAAPVVLALSHNAGGPSALLDSLLANQEVFVHNKLVNSATSPYRVDAVALVERALDASRQPLVGWAVTAVVLAVTAVRWRGAARATAKRFATPPS